jgi:hypothetical protein
LIGDQPVWVFLSGSPVMRAVNKESVTEDLAHLTVPFQIELNAEISQYHR